MKKKVLPKYPNGGNPLLRAAMQIYQTQNQKVPDLRRYVAGNPEYNDWLGYAQNADQPTIDMNVAADKSPTAGQLQSNLGESDNYTDTTHTDERRTGVYDLHPAFKAVNTLALATTGIANLIKDGKNGRKEKLKYAQSLQSPFIENDPVQNDIPMYAKYGLRKMPDGGSIDNRMRSEWNNYVQWLRTKNLGGSADLDKDGRGLQLLDEYRKTNPNTLLNKDVITPIQQDFQKYRQWVIDQHKAGKAQMASDPGQNYENFMPELSTVDGYPGSRTTSHMFPNQYMTSFDENGQVIKKEKNLIDTTTAMAKMPYGGGKLTSEGAKEILRDGTIKGKKLTDKQKKYFGYIAGGGEPKAKYGIDVVANGDDMIKIKDDAPTHEQGGVNVNNQVEVEAGEVVDVNNGDVQRVLENTSTERNDLVSQALKIDPAKFQSLFGFKTTKSLSHADALTKAHEYFAKKEGKVNKAINKNAEDLEENKNDYYANNTFDLNTRTAKTIPSKNDIFNLLFQHQEQVKGLLDAHMEKAQYGGKYLPQAATGYDPNDVTPYEGDKYDNPRNKKLTTKTSNKSRYTTAQWEDIKTKLGYTGPDDNKAFQRYLDAKFPDIVNKYHSDSDPEGFGMPSVTKKKIDGYLGVRWDAIVDDILKPKPDPQQPAPQQPAAKTPVVAPDPTMSHLELRKAQQASRFNEPLRWFDTASPLMALIENGRIPANYNPVELNKVKLHLQNPEPALEAGNRDYNAALSILPNTGAGMANVTQAFNSKYSLDNQVLGQYENTNNQIKNQETLYNAGVGDRQSVADQQSRSVFEQQRLMGIEAQRQQKLTSFDELFSRIALNRKLNREGNLIMQMFPNYNQYANYNGNQRYFSASGDGQGLNTSGAEVVYTLDPKTGKYIPSLSKDGKLQSKSKVLYGLPK